MLYGLFPACLYVYHLHVVPTMARRGWKSLQVVLHHVGSTKWAQGTQPEWGLCKAASTFKHRAISPVPGDLLPPTHTIFSWFVNIYVNFLTFLCLSFSTWKVVGRFFRIDSKLRVGSVTLETAGGSTMLRTALEACRPWSLVKAVL